MNSMMLQQYQARVLGPSEVVNYSGMVIEAYPKYARDVEPFIGLKVLCRDMNANSTDPNTRLRQIDASLRFLTDSGCIIRETSAQIPDGFWVITLPVPRSQIYDQITRLKNVLSILAQYQGIVRTSVFEVNASGKCSIAETERCLNSLVIPPKYKNGLLTPDNTPYRVGYVVRINDFKACLRTRWDLSSPENVLDDMIYLSQIISGIFH